MRHWICAGLIILSPCAASALPVETSMSDLHKQKTDSETDQHAAWSEILARYVVESADGINRFDYTALREHTNDRAKLKAYIDALSSQAISTLPDAERFAAYANLYNALTIQLIVEHEPVSSITKIRPGLFSIGPWKKELIEVEGETLSLDEIEHEKLRKGFGDPRVHYAVNCASLGCPNLKATAWEAETLDADLDAAAREYINHPRGVTIRSDGRLQVSTIYRWFREDFGGNEDGVIAHLLAYAEPDLAEKIRANPDIADHKYDWSINSPDA